MRGVLNLLGPVAWLLAVLLAACGTQPADPASAQMQIARARSPFDSDGNRINGRKVFLRENCYICHGGRGGGGMCPSLRRGELDDPEDTIRNGTRSGMPAFAGRVTGQEIQDLVAYLESLRTPGEPTFTHWWEAVPSQ
jgi:mono/diheme cytochrome c family protein